MKKILILVLSCLCSCVGEKADLTRPESGITGTVSLHLSGIRNGLTRASLLEGADNVTSGASVYVFRHLSGGGSALESVQPVSAEYITRGEGSLEIKVPMGFVFDFYVVGNLWAIDRTSGLKVELASALGAGFPSSSDELEEIVYRFGGGEFGPACRTETMAEVKTYGIPFAGNVKNVDVSSTSNVNLVCKYLFAKLRLTVDHSGFDSDGTHSSGSSRWFTNSSVALRQVCNRLQPFGTGAQQVQSASDVSEVADGDLALSNSEGSTTNVYEFFLPENMQGTLLPVGADQREKTPEALAAVGHDASLCSYIEFVGRLGTGAAGFGGDYTYRFYLGKDNNSNFDVERGLLYDVRLSFRPESIFDPSWMVDDNGTFSDSRLFRITADSAYSEPLGDTSGDGQMVAVRKHRPAKLYVYMNKDGVLSSSNLLEGRQVRDADYRVTSLDDCAWTGDFINQSGTASQIPQKSALEQMGVAASYDPATACLTFSVVDDSSFDAHVGEEVPLTVTLLPAGKTITFSVKTFEDFGVTVENGTLDGEDFFVGMRRRVRFSGFAGETIHYYNEAVPVKKSMKAYDSDSNFSYILDKNAPGQTTPSSLPFDIYACRNNGSGRTCTLVFESEDTFNDGGKVTLPCLAHKVYPEVNFRPYGGKYLFLAGDDAQFYVSLYSDPSHANVIHRDLFDDIAYADCLEPTFIFDCGTFDGSQIECVDAGLHLLATGFELYNAHIKKVPSEPYYSIKSHNVFLVCTAPGYDDEDTQFREMVIPAFDLSYDAGRDYSVSIADIHDYSLLNRDMLADEYRTGSFSAESYEVKFGVKSADDVRIEFDRGHRYLKASVDDDSAFYMGGVFEPLGGSMIFDFKDYETLNADGSTHPVGPITVYPFTVNRYSGQKISGTPLAAKVFVHIAVGACAFKKNIDNLNASFDLYAWIVGRNTLGKVVVGPDAINDLLKSQYSDFDGLSALNPNYSVTYGERMEAGSGPLPDEGASINGEKYLNVTWSVVDDTSSQYQEILALNNDPDGLTFFGEGGSFPRPRFLFWDVNRLDGLGDSINLDIDGFKDPVTGKGYYVLEKLSTLCPATRGWINIYEDIGMPVGAPNAYYPAY